VNLFVLFVVSLVLASHIHLDPVYICSFLLAVALPSATRLPALVATHCLSFCRHEHQQLQVICSYLAGGILLYTDGNSDNGLAGETER
jgi:hypothetical protein